MAEEDETALRAGALGVDATQRVSPDLPPLSAGSMRAAPAAGTLIGKYIVERTIGAGGMGIVVAARHEQLGELVAIKLLHPKASKDKVQVERFVREARATVRIKSEHVVRVLDAGADEVTGAPFIVMEHLEGSDLGHVLERHGAMPIATAVDMMLQICEAVAAAHALGIIHRDLKPSNFFVTRRADGAPLIKVLDFGISKARSHDGAPDPRLTETQAVFGSPTYMSPEQIRSSKNVDPRSDVWSLGVGLFEMLTGKLPFIAETVSGLLASVVADPPFRVSAFSPHVPEELEAIVLGCLEKDPSRRIGSAAELAMRLAPYASPEGMQLAARIERIARAAPTTRPSFHPDGTLVASSTHPSLPPMSAPLPPLSRPSAPGAAAFGSTGDLSATGPALKPARRGALVAVVLALTVFAAAGGGLAVYVNTRQPLAATSASATHALDVPPSAEPLPVVASSAITSPSATAPNLAAPENAPSSAASVAGVPGRRGVPARPGAGRVAPPTPPAVSAPPPPVPATAAPTPKPDPTQDRR